MNPIDAVKEYVRMGISALPGIKSRKCPFGSWKEYQKRFVTDDELIAYPSTVDAVCLITGAVSGNLELIDFDFEGIDFENWLSLVKSRITNPRYILCRSQRGGLHVVYRCETKIEGNLKLCSRKIDGALSTTIETRGEGGQFLASPTNGYTIIEGDFRNLPVISKQERDSYIFCARSMSESPSIVHGELIHTGGRSERFNFDGDITEILKKKDGSKAKHRRTETNIGRGRARIRELARP